MDRRDSVPTAMLAPVVRLLFSYREGDRRRDFVLAELGRGVGLVACYGLYRDGWFVVAATLVPVAVRPGVVATIERFRDLGHDPVLILPALTYPSAGVAVGYRYESPEISVIALGVYLLYAGGVEGQPETFGSGERVFDS